MSIKLGMAVLLAGTVVSRLNAEHLPEEQQGFGIQLSDGQSVQTNSRNITIAVDPEEADEIETTADVATDPVKPKGKN